MGDGTSIGRVRGLGAAKEGNPGPLVTFFSHVSGTLSCPVFIVPGGLSDEDIDRLS